MKASRSFAVGTAILRTVVAAAQLAALRRVEPQNLYRSVISSVSPSMTPARPQNYRPKQP